jgi:hypothetical protein
MKKHKRKFIIETTRVEYHRCRYLVEARSEDEAQAIFDDPDHPSHDRDACALTEDCPVDAEEHVCEVYTEAEAKAAGLSLIPDPLG